MRPNDFECNDYGLAKKVQFCVCMSVNERSEIGVIVEILNKTHMVT